MKEALRATLADFLASDEFMAAMYADYRSRLRVAESVRSMVGTRPEPHPSNDPLREYFTVTLPEPEAE